MADETKKYLVNIESNLNKYAQDAADAKKKVDELKESNKALKESGQASAAQIEANEAALRNAQKEYRQSKSALDTLTKASRENATEREKLSAIVSIETKKLNDLGNGYTRNAKGLLVLNPQYEIQKKAVADANKAIIDYDLSINKGGTNVGRYAAAIGDIGKNMLGMVGPAALAAAAVKAATKIWEGMKDALMSTTFVMNTVNDINAAMKQTFFDLAINQQINIDKIKEAISVQNELNRLRLQDGIEMLNISKLNREEQAIREIAIDKTKTQAEKLEALNRVVELENEKTKIKVGNLNDELVLKERLFKQNSQDEKLFMEIIALKTKINDTYAEEDQALRRINSQRTGIIQDELERVKKQHDDLMKAADEEIEMQKEKDKKKKDDAKKAADERTKILQQESKDQISLRLALAKGDAEATKKALKFQYDTEIANSELTNTQKELLHVNYLNAIAEIDKASEEKWKTDTTKANEDKLALDQEYYNMRLEDAEGNLELTKQIIDQEYEALKKSDRWKKMSILEQTKIEREYTKTNKVLSENKIDQKRREVQALGEATGAIAQLLGEETAAGKGFAVAQALINTFLSAAMTMTDKTIPSTYLRIATMVSVIATGLANVQKILSVDTSGGASISSSVSSISTTAARITAPSAISTGTSILNPSGQITQQTQTAIESASLTANDVAEAVKNVTIVTTIEDINARQKSTNKIKNRATI